MRFLEFRCDECGRTATEPDREMEWYQGVPPGWFGIQGFDTRSRHLCPRCLPLSIDATEFVQVVLGDGGPL